MDILIKLILTLFTFAAIMIFTFSIFRVPIKSNDKQIAILALVVGSTNFYFKFVIDSPYFFLAQMVVWMVLMIILRGYPILYSMIVCITGSIFISIVDGIISFSAAGLHISTMDKMINNSLHYVVFHIIVTLFYLLLSMILIKFKIGFSFVRMRFLGKYALKTYNFVWAAILILVVALLQINVNSYNTKSFNFYLIILLSVIMFIAVYNAFVKNKESVKSRAGLEESKKNEPS